MKLPYTLLPALLFSMLSFSNNESCAPTPKIFTGTNADRMIPGATLVREGRGTAIPSFVRFKEGEEIALAGFETWVKETFGMDDDDALQLYQVSRKDVIGQVHYRYRQIYKGHVVKGGVYIAHCKDGKVLSVNGVLFDDLNLPVSGTLSEQHALQRALQFTGAETYQWELPGEEARLKWETQHADATYYPKGHLVYAPKNGDFGSARNFKLCWEFNIYAHKPLSRKEVYVDAVTGEIVFTNDLIREADVLGTAETQYSGIKTITADDQTGPYRLREAARGNGIETYDLNNGTNYGNAVDFTDNDNYWANYNGQLDEYATDAHFGTETTYDYYWYIHNRNSIDDNGFALLSYVHYSNNYVNAFWDGQRMTYGDGNGGSITPLTTLDICGHEVTHGLTSYTSDLTYSNESGALNESFSDIFGTCIEWYGDSINPDWLIGEDIGTSFRSMSNPKSKGDPDCYQGVNWYSGSNDNGGVHTNSGVQNKWFYILTMGETGTNDNNNNYSVTGIGIVDASKIAFRNNTVYLTPSSQYADARFYAIQSAQDLFGPCSPEVVATTDAWYAVCVGAQFSANVTADFTESGTTSCHLPFTVSFTNQSSNANTFYWDFGDNTSSTQQNPTHTYTSPGQYSVTLIADGGNCGSDTIVYTNLIDITLPAAPSVLGDSICGAGTANLSASGSGQLDWYDQQSGGNWLHTGNTYAPAVTSTTSFWVEDLLLPASQYVGPVDDNIGSGNYYNFNQYLIFDVFSSCTLKSVWVDANGSGNRTVELRDDQGNVLQSATINIPNGQSTITLNFPLTPGTNYRLGIQGNNNDLYRNNGGVNYPYTLNGLVSITSSSAGQNYYYFYYNWEIIEDTCISARTEVVAAVTPLPSVSVTSSSDSLCAGDTVVLNANGSNVSSYLWSPNNQTDSLITETPVTTTTYTVTAMNICDTVTDSFTVHVVSGPPVAAFTSSSVGLTVNFTDQSANATAWYWDFGDGNNSTQQNPSHTYGSDGTYAVTLIVSNFCGNDTVIQNVTVITTGMTEQNGLEQLNIYPNPLRDVLYISFSSLTRQKVQISLSNITGQLIYTEDFEAHLGAQTHSCHLQGLAPGAYSFRMTTDTGIFNKTIMIE